MKLFPPRAPAALNRPLPTSLDFATQEIEDPSDTHTPTKFLKAHFGNPEKDEHYGVGNDYETEADQTKDEKAWASQAIWYLGAFVLIMMIGVLIFGYR